MNDQKKIHGNKGKTYNTANHTGIRRADFASYDEYFAAYQAAYRRQKFIEKNGLPPEEVERFCNTHPETRLEKVPSGQWGCPACLREKIKNRAAWEEMMAGAAERKRIKADATEKKRIERERLKSERAKKKADDLAEKEAQTELLRARPKSLSEGLFLTESERVNFMEKIRQDGDCLVWTGSDKFSVHGVNYPPHRLCWFLENGPIKDGMVLHKECETKGCINPLHRKEAPPFTAKPKETYIPVYKEIPDFTPEQIERFHGYINQDGDCWVWTGKSDEEGYGRFQASGPSYQAHRVAFKLANGSIVRDLQVTHLCNSTYCCNPAHLSQGSMNENFGNSVEDGRQMSQEFMEHRVIPDAEDEQEIRRLISLKVRDRAIYRKFGVSFETIARIKGGM